MSIFQTIQKYESDFLQTPVTIVDGYKFNQLETIKDNQRQYAGIFKNGNEDEFGYKYYFKEGKPRVKNAAKNIDIDTKDANIKASLPKNYYKAWIMRRDIRFWMKKRKLGKVFNSMAMMTPKYGHFVLKKVEGKEIIREVPLKNIKNDATAKSIKDSWVIEDHFYTPWELQKEVELRGWDQDQVDKAIKSFLKTGKENYVDNYSETDTRGSAQYIHVKEFVGDVPENQFNESSKDISEKGDENKFVFSRWVVISAEGASEEGKEDGLKLSEPKKLTSHPYKDVKYDEEEGRWLGVGIIEDLKDTQIMKNEQVNLMMLGLRLSNLILLQCQDETIARNIMQDVINGDILKAKSAISRIDTRNYGSADSNIISQEIDRLANFLANTPEVTTGDNLPSGTPFSLGALMDRNVNKLFDFIRENMGLFLEEVFEDWIIPDLEKDLNKKHILEFTDKDEMEWIAKRFQSAKLLSKIGQFILARGRKPTNGEVLMATEVLKIRMEGKEELFLDIPDDFYDFEKSVVVDFTGESENKSVTLQSMASIMEMVNGNPGLLESPAMKKIMDIAGYSAVDFSTPQVAPNEVNQINQVAQLTPAGQPPGQPPLIQ